MELQFKDEVIPRDVDRSFQDKKSDGGEELTHVTASLEEVRLNENGSSTVSSSKNT